MPMNISGPKINSAMRTFGRVAFGGRPKVIMLKIVGWYLILGVITGILNPQNDYRLVPPQEAFVKIADPQLDCNENAECILTIRALEGANFLDEPPQVKIEDGCGIVPKGLKVKESGLAYVYFIVNDQIIERPACDLDVTAGKSKHYWENRFISPTEKN